MCSTESSGSGSRWRNHTCCWEALPGRRSSFSCGTIRMSHSANCLKPASSNALISVRARQILRWRRRRHRVLMMDSALVGLERRRHRKDGLPVLDRVDPPGGERAAVAEALDDEYRGRLGISGPQEVAVQGVHLILGIDRSYRRHQRLAGDVTTERALPVARLRAEDAAAVDVDLELLEIKDLLDRHYGLFFARALITSFLPAALGEPVRGGDLLHVDTDHGLPQPARHLGQHVGVVIKGGGLDDRGGPL